MPINLIAVRHGITDHNKAGILQGQRINSSLAPEGIIRAQQIAEELQHEPDIAAFYSSPRFRAMQTAEIIAEVLKLPIIQRPEIQETDFGTLSGKRWEDIPENTDNTLKEKNKTLQYDYRPFGGEDVTQVRSRLQQFLEFLRQNHRHQTILTVTHGGILRLLHDELKIPQPNHIESGSIHRLEI